MAQAVVCIPTLHRVARTGDVDKVRALERRGDPNERDGWGRTPLHWACEEGHLEVARVLIAQFKCDMSIQDVNGFTAFMLAILRGHSDVAHALLEEYRCPVDVEGKHGDTLLHYACGANATQLVRTLVQKYHVDKHARNNDSNTPLHVAVLKGHQEVALVMIQEFRCDARSKGFKGRSVLHIACGGGNVGLVSALVTKHKADINARDADNNTPLHVAAYSGKDEVVHALVRELKCDFTCKGFNGRSVLHVACSVGNIDLVRTLVRDFKADLNVRDDHGNTPIHVAAYSNQQEIAVKLIKEFGHNVNIEGFNGRSALHIACDVGNVGLVRSLLQECLADVNVRDSKNSYPLHVAAYSGQIEVTQALIGEFDCDVSLKGFEGRSALHSACAGGSADVVEFLCKCMSPLVVDDSGNTPLHTSSAYGHSECVKALLEANAPLLLRNTAGKTPMDIASKEDIKLLLTDYLKHSAFLVDYSSILMHARKKYPMPEHITRIFVLGNPGAGKSSLIEILKREGFLDSFRRESESSVPPHTAGIVPSIHTSKHYGRVLFYDFGGDAEYYSSLAVILENLASSRKGDNIFLLVIDMSKEMAEIKIIFHYWLSFIQHHQFHGQKPHLIVVGSHLDLLTGDVARARGKEFEMFCDSIDTEAVQMSAFFMLDCCKPRSKQTADIQTLLSRITKDSPCSELSLQARILLGLLDKDFSYVTACSTRTLLSHIEETHIALPTDTQLFRSILLELHNLGLLFLIDSSNRESSSVVLNMSQLTNIVHKSLFSKPAIFKKKFAKEGLSFLFHAGILPQSILARILPENITKECLVQLQYCQEISHAEAHVFPSLKVSNSTDQSFLFFPALCSADKSEVEWVTPPDLSYGIGWLALCTDPCDYLSPRFHHVLMLRLVFKFTLSAPHTAASQVSSGSPDLGHFQHRCTMWKTGVHWLMEEGVECMVELAGANREVVVLTRSTKDRAENCATVFNDIVSCVMEAKAEFCHSVRLEFFLLDSTSEADYHSADNLFAMRDVERVLTSAGGRAEVIVSVTGKRQMERSKLLCLRNFTLWYSLFPMDLKPVLHYIKDIVRELYMLGLHLGIPKGILDAIEADNRTDVCKMRRELVKGWMRSSLDPPCWWHLVNALRALRWSVLAEEIATEFGKY